MSLTRSGCCGNGAVVVKTAQAERKGGLPFMFVGGAVAVVDHMVKRVR